MVNTRRLMCTGLLLTGFGVIGCAVTPLSPSNEQRLVLSPTGRLRVGIHTGSPTKGVIADVGKALAESLAVEYELIQFAAQADLLSAISEGKVDFSGTNASPARAARMDFTATVLDVELGYLVLAGSAVSSIDQVDRIGVRVGVTQGSTSLTILPKILKNATVVSTTSTKSAQQLFLAKEIDAYATNKAILQDMMGGIPNSAILEGNWGFEHWAVCIPKGRQTGLVYLRDFTDYARNSGLIKRSIERDGLRWLVIPEA